MRSSSPGGSKAPRAGGVITSWGVMRPFVLTLHRTIPIAVARRTRTASVMPPSQPGFSAHVPVLARSGSQSCRELLVDASPVQINTLEPPAQCGRDLARGGQMLQMRDHEAAHRLVIAR